MYETRHETAPEKPEQVQYAARKRGRKILLVALALVSAVVLFCAPIAWKAWQIYGAFDAMVFDHSRVIPEQQEAVAKLMKKDVMMLRDRTRSVTSIVAMECKLDDADFDALLCLTTAKELYLSGSDFPPERLADLRRFNALKSLYLACVDLSSGDMEQVSQIHQLVALDLRATGIDDASLISLQQLPNLRFVDLAGTLVTEAGVDGLQKARPGLSINLDDTDERYIKW